MNIEIINKLPFLLAILPMNGMYYPTTKVVDVEEMLKQYNSNGWYKIIKFDYNEYNELLGYLIEKGFAIIRHDIDRKPIELTIKGRHLKEAGSLTGYDNFVEDNKHKLSILERRNTLIFYTQVLIAFWTGIAAIYYLLQIWLTIKNWK